MRTVPKKVATLMPTHFKREWVRMANSEYNAVATEKKDMLETLNPNTTHKPVVLPHGCHSTHEALEWIHEVSLTQKIIGLCGSGMVYGDLHPYSHAWLAPVLLHIVTSKFGSLVAKLSTVQFFGTHEPAICDKA